MVIIPDYETYELIELYEVLNNVRGDLYPEVLEALEAELARRDTSSVSELEDCYFVLNRDRYPDYAAALLARIESLGGFSLQQKEEITDENRYRTFWRRFWAHFIDGLAAGIPLGLIMLGAEKALASGPLAHVLVDYVGQLLWLAYYIAMHARYGQTLGKMATGVKLFDRDERRDITLRQALLRDCVPLLFATAAPIYFAVFGLPQAGEALAGAALIVPLAVVIGTVAWYVAEIVTMLFNRKRRAVHDLIAGTVVVRVP